MRRASTRRGRRHSGVAIGCVAWLFLGTPASAQTERGMDIMEEALALQPDMHNGARLYRSHCVSCHGRRARGDANKVVPALAGQLPTYSIKQLADVGEGLRTAPEMHRTVARKALTTPNALRDVTAYLGTLPPNPEPERGDGKQLALGKRGYEGLCAFCHGARGEGDEEHATPALRGQHYSYLLAQTRLIAAGHRYAVDIGIADTIGVLPYDYLTAIADYASRLQGDAP
jgi:cytochrome c553